jgi:glycosyltransferase involved in cell wall biosynthesis
VWERSGKFDLHVLSKIRNTVKAGGYKGIISSYTLYQMIATIGLRNCPKTIYPIHSTVDKNTKVFLIRYLIYRLKRHHEIFLTSIDAQTSYLTQAHRLKTGFFHQIYNGVDTESFIIAPAGFDKEKVKSDLGFSADQRIILMVAGFRSEKRHVDAFEAFALVQKESGNIGLLCVGDNRIKERDELKKVLYQKNIRNVVFLSAEEAGDIKKYYWISDLFTLTSNKVETFSISALEAMACGLPCVLTRTGGAVDIINEQNGLTCEPEDTAGIANAWAEVLSKPGSYNKHIIRKYVLENYSINKAADEYLKLLNLN